MLMKKAIRQVGMKPAFCELTPTAGRENTIIKHTFFSHYTRKVRE
jgi:hypothetical protein